MTTKHITALSRRRRTRNITVLMCLAAALCVAACGSSSSSTTTAAASASSTAPSGTPASTGTQRAKITACLQKAGITLPARPPGSGNGTPGATTAPRTGGVFGGGGGGAFSNPAAQAALKKCGITVGQRPAGTSRVKSPAYQTAVNNYVACMSKNGDTLPKPNFSGKGPVFTASQVNRNDAKFKTASAKCQQLLNAA